MAIEIIVPSVGESIQEAILVEWFKKDSEWVEKDEPIFVIETDKVTLEVVATESGRLEIKVKENQTVKIGSIVGLIHAEVDRPPIPKSDQPVKKAPSPEIEKSPPLEAPKAAAPVMDSLPAEPVLPDFQELAPSVRRIVAEKNIDLKGIQGTGPGGRITKSDVLLHMEQQACVSSEPSPPSALPETEAAFTRKPMSPLRRKIAERLLEAKQNTAMLTTFNEIDMSRLKAIRARYKDQFEKKYDVRLGFMSFFIKASVAALKAFPVVNASIDGQDILYHHQYHIGVAVGTERGLVVPVIFDADQKGYAALEQTILDYVTKIKTNRLNLAELEGGTFTITNGGVYGSLLSTPILNIPQSAILGMHKIEDRPIAVDGQVVIRPMMYVALSYDHRIIDGREAVSFLALIKALIENPERMLMEI